MKLSELLKVHKAAKSSKKENNMSSDILTEDEERRLMAEAQFKEADSYINQVKDYFKDDKELEKMRDEIAELPTIDKKEYYCPDCCSTDDKKEYYCPDCCSTDLLKTNYYHNGEMIDHLTCSNCHKSFTKKYLEDHGFYIDDSIRYRVAKRPSEDFINHPEHYISKDGIESIDVIRAFTRDLYGIEAVCTANILKYMMRWNHKNGLEDLKKAQWYLNYLITEVEVEDNNE